MKAALSDPDALGWIEVSQPDVDFDGIGIGAMVSWECDLFVPDIIRTISRSGEALDAITMMQRLLPSARRLGPDTEGLPDEDEMDAVTGFISGLNANQLIVGEDEETNWRVAARLTDDCIRGDVEGWSRIVGKVARVLSVGQWMPHLPKFSSTR